MQQLFRVTQTHAHTLMLWNAACITQTAKTCLFFYLPTLHNDRQLFFSTKFLGKLIACVQKRQYDSVVCACCVLGISGFIGWFIVSDCSLYQSQQKIRGILSNSFNFIKRWKSPVIWKLLLRLFEFKNDELHTLSCFGQSSKATDIAQERWRRKCSQGGVSDCQGWFETEVKGQVYKMDVVKTPDTWRRFRCHRGRC